MKTDTNIHIGLVVNNNDPEGRGRVQVFIPHITNTLYEGWNSQKKDIKFKTLDSDIFNPDLFQRLTDVLPWAEVSAPFFGGGTGAPVNQDTSEPTPTPTTPSPVLEAGGYAIEPTPPTGDDIYSGIRTKDGVKFQGTVPSGKKNAGKTVSLNPELADFARYMSAKNPYFTVTSGVDGNHAFASGHYDGRGLDVRTTGLGDDTKMKSVMVDVAAEAAKRGLLVRIEGDHLDIKLGEGAKVVIDSPNAKWANETRQTYEASLALNSSKSEHPKLDGLNNLARDVGGSSSETNKSLGDLNSNNSQTSSTQKNNLIADRKKYLSLLDDANNKNKLFSLIAAEVGNIPSDEGKKAYIESILNRASARNQSPIPTTKNELAYYPSTTINKIKTTPIQDSTKYEQLVRDVINNGTNYSNFATGNGSLDVGVGYQTTKQQNNAEGEKFGIENNNNDLKWASNVGADVDKIKQDSNILISENKTYGGGGAGKITNMFANRGTGDSRVGGGGTAMGMFSIPQVGAKAYVMFLGGNLLKPIVIGSYLEPSNIASA